MVVFLNKQDILKEKIKEGKKIENYFPEYASYQIEPSEMDPNIPPKFNRARCFIKHKLVVSIFIFKRYFILFLRKLV